MDKQVIKKARGTKGQCEVCGKRVGKGDEFVDTGYDGHGGLTGLRHKTCINGQPWWIKKEIKGGKGMTKAYAERAMQLGYKYEVLDDGQGKHISYHYTYEAAAQKASKNMQWRVLDLRHYTSPDGH